MACILELPGFLAMVLTVIMVKIVTASPMG
jgi:hypothetical protein